MTLSSQGCHVDYIFNNTIFFKGDIRPENKQNFRPGYCGNSGIAIRKSIFFLLLLLSSPEQSCFSCLPSLIFFLASSRFLLAQER